MNHKIVYLSHIKLSVSFQEPMENGNHKEEKDLVSLERIYGSNNLPESSDYFSQPKERSTMKSSCCQ